MGGSVVITVRIPREFKEAMNMYSAKVNWSEENRNFIMRRITELKQEEALNKLNSIIKKLPELPPGSATSLMREGRNDH